MVGAASSALDTGMGTRARPLTGHGMGVADNAGQGDVVEIDVDIDIESSQANISIQ